jgi:hypothetical protein
MIRTEGGDESHFWVERFNLTCCQRCGIVRRADRQNKPCPGIVRVVLREATPPQGDET